MSHAPTASTPAADPPEFPSDHSFDLYLRRLRWALSDLPESDRDEIVAETLSLLLDSVGGNATYEEAAARLGEPETYARGFLESYEISATLGSGSPWRMLLLTLRFAGRSVYAFFAALGLFVLYVMALSFTAIAFLKPIFPEEIGLWSHPESFHFALGHIAGAPEGARELL
ncbi:MAG: hypothetical protein AAF368_15860, partial [Planctomycetota bacterium]